VRELIGILVANLVLAGAGTGVLLALGERPRGRIDSALFCGLAVMTGVAVVMTLQVFLLIAGTGHVGFKSGTLISVLVLGLGAAIGIRREGPVRWRPRAPKIPPLRQLMTPGWVLSALAGAGLLVLLVAAGRYYTVSPAATFDDFAIWSKKALVLYHYGALPTDFALGSAYTPMHQEYPMLFPALESFVMHAMGGPDTRMIHLESLALLIAFAAAAAYMLRTRGPALAALPLLGLVLVAPAFHDQLATGYADLPTSFFVGLGVMAVGLWLEERRPALLVLAALMLGAAAQMKLEALMAAVIAFGVLFVLLTARRQWPLIKEAALALAGMLAMIAPWNVWVRAHPEIESFFHPSRGLDPSYLNTHWDLPGEALELIGRSITHPDFLMLAPIALAVTIISLAARRGVTVGAFYLVTAVGLTAGLVWIYWVDPTTWSPNRVVDMITFVGIVGALHLLAMIGREPEDAQTSSGTRKTATSD
jgi:hypothetical protein